MLTDLEPEFDIRFVEKSISKARSETQPIENFPCVVGHSGNIRPLLLNGTISNKHCTVRYDLDLRSYVIEDGADGKPSSNHIYSGDEGEETKEVSTVLLNKIGQRVYLLRLMGGDEGYIELYDAKKEAFCGRKTMDLDPQLVRTTATAVEAHSIAKQNAETIQKLEGRLGQILAFSDALSRNPRRTLTAIGLTFIALCLGTPFLLLYLNQERLMDAAIERYKHSHGYQKTEKRN